MIAHRFTCPRCGMTSQHPSDVLEGYCGACHDWTGERLAGTGRGPRHFDRDGKPITMMEWAAQHDDDTQVHVAFDRVDDVEVSTVWMGIDHRFGQPGPPLIFETMIFGGPLDQHQWRYSTLDDALEGHAAALELARAAAIERP